MIDWSIQARAHQCQGCGRAFRERESLHTLLFDEHSEYHRLDVCETCWADQYSQSVNHRRGFVSHWMSVYSAPAPAPVDPIQKETAESLLRKLVERREPRYAATCFILAVMLERKRLFKMKNETLEEGRRLLIYEQAKSGDLFTIPDPGLQLDQLEAVQREVAHLLEHGLDPVPAATPATTDLTPPPDVPSTSSTSTAPPAGAGAVAPAEPEPAAADPGSPNPQP